MNSSSSSSSSSSTTSANSTTVSTPSTSSTSTTTTTANKFDYYFVLDFEATCNDPVQTNPQEIIEFPIVVVDAQTKKIVEEFHHFVKPEVHPTLSAFCTQLTGITQAQVNGGKPLVEVLRLAEEFVAKYTAKGNCTMVTCGHWDLDKMLRSQTKLLKIDTKTVSFAPFRSWINIKVSYQAFRGRDKKARQSGMAEMLRELRLPLVGKHHCGLDDARNIASILIELLGNGAALDVNGSY